MLKASELWFVVIANPDGYQYTFQSPDTRLWRKTLRDNDGNGVITVGDGVANVPQTAGKGDRL